MVFSTINLTLSIIILLLFATIGYVYKLYIEIELLKEDILKLKHSDNS
jgi:hypothetical protein